MMWCWEVLRVMLFLWQVFLMIDDGKLLKLVIEVFVVCYVSNFWLLMQLCVMVLVGLKLLISLYIISCVFDVQMLLFNWLVIIMNVLGMLGLGI